MHVEAGCGIRAADIPTDAACCRFRGTPRVGKGNEKDVSMECVVVKDNGWYDVGRPVTHGVSYCGVAVRRPWWVYLSWDCRALLLSGL